MYVQRQGPFPGLVAQQLIAHKFLNDFDLVIIGALAGHLPLFPIVPQGPERDAGGTGTAKIAGEVPI